MRRISIAMMLLVLMPGITRAGHVARHHGIARHAPSVFINESHYDLVKYSPYAFGYHSNGLVPGGIDYSPYAFRPGTPGLVFEGMQYTPYAFNYGNSGLVLNYYWYPIPYVMYNPSCPAGQVPAAYKGISFRPCSGQPKDTSSYPRYSQSTCTVPAPRSIDRPVAADTRDDPLNVIRQHLRGQGFADVGVNRILRVDNKLVSADFTVGGRNLLIKYWDPEQVGDETRVAGNKMIEKYKNDWEAFAGKYQQDGGEIYVVAASERTEIVAALDTCKSLKPADAKPGEQTMYARQ